MNQFKIGAQMFAVHKKYADQNICGGRIVVCRVKTFENKAGKILPVLTEVGNTKREISADFYYFYANLSEAIEAIKTV
jgi:hypothetical protein